MNKPNYVIITTNKHYERFDDGKITSINAMKRTKEQQKTVLKISN